MAAPRLALFGKLPARGDFIAHAVPRAVETAWTDWMQPALASHVRGRLAPERSYLAGPTWAFVLRRAALGTPPITGVVIPSKDCEGRCFPLALFGIWPDDASPFDSAAANAGWFRAARAVLVAAQDSPPAPEAIGGALPDWTPDAGAGLTAMLALAPGDGTGLTVALLLDEAPEAVVSLWWSLDDDDPPHHVLVQTGPCDDELWRRLFVSVAAYHAPGEVSHDAL